ncbi:MAG TPA: DUF1565 domain-containing protein [Deinococcales bacterium]|nr:DUF1565 domain-containing protein [Deinococcales bacterium]
MPSRALARPSWLAAALLALLTACPTGGGPGGLSVSPASASLTPGDAPVTFTARGGDANLAWTLDPAGAGTLSATTGTSVQYTPPAGASAPLTVTLTAAAPGGTPAASASIAINPIPALYVDAAGGLDSNDGTQAHPFKTLGKALTTVRPGGNVVLLAGTYSGASGETWGYDVPAGVSIRANTDGVILSTISPATPGLNFLGGGELRFVTMNGFAPAVAAHQGSLALTGVTANSTATDQKGLVADGTAGVSLTDCTFATRGGALTLAGNASLSMTNGLLAGPGWVLEAADSVHATLTNVEINGNGKDTPMDIGGTAALTLKNVNLHDEASYAIYMRNGQPSLTVNGGTFRNTSHQAYVIDLEEGSATVDGAQFDQVGTALGARDSQASVSNTNVSNGTGPAFSLSGTARFKLRSSNLYGNSSGVAINAATVTADLGTAADPGGNTIQDNKTATASFGANLVGDWGATTVLQAVGNTWNANTQGSDADGHYPAGLVLCGTVAETGVVNYWCGQTNQIQF